MHNHLKTYGKMLFIIAAYLAGAVISALFVRGEGYFPVLWVGGGVALLSLLVRDDNSDYLETARIMGATFVGAILAHWWAFWLTYTGAAPYFVSYHVVGLGFADTMQIYLTYRLVYFFKIRYFELARLREILSFLLIALAGGVFGGLAIKQGVVSFYTQIMGSGLVTVSYPYWFVADLLASFVFAVFFINLYYRGEKLWDRRLMEVSLPAVVTFFLIMILVDVTCPGYFGLGTMTGSACQVAGGGIAFNFLILGSLLFISGRYYRNEESMRVGAERINTINRKLGATLKSSWAMNANMQQSHITAIAAATAFHVADLKHVLLIGSAYAGAQKVYSYSRDAFSLIDLESVDYGEFLGALDHKAIDYDVIKVTDKDTVSELIAEYSYTKHCDPYILPFPASGQNGERLASNGGIGLSGALVVFSHKGKGIVSSSETLLKTIASSASIAMWNLHMLIRERENSSRLSQSDTILNSASEGVFIVNRKLEITQINPSFTRITGLDKRAVMGKVIYRLPCYSWCLAVMRQIRSDLLDKGRWDGELDCTREDGTPFSISITLTAVKDKTGIVYFAGVFSDITRFKENAHILQHQADHDDLTGLANRKRFNRELSDSLVRSAESNTGCGVLYIDLDKFKEINDNMGHHIGDELLVQVSQRLLSCVRGSDLIARLGGDEFAIILQRITGVAAVERVASIVLKELNKPFILDGEEVHITGSIGISVYPDHGTDRDELIRFADSAMYEAKREGRNGFVAYTPEMSESAQARYDLTTDLRSALATDGLTLFYQPQVTVEHNKLVGFEALIRWQHPEKGLLTPSEFIQIAHEAGLIVQLDEWVLEEGFKQYRKWLDSGFLPGRLSLNISGEQLVEPSFADLLKTLTQRYRVDPGCIELEISENFVMKQAAVVVAALTTIRKMGFYLSIDDFGTGYSSLSYLQKLPIDTLKLDGAFIENIEESEDNALIAKAIISLAHNMRKRIIAEGVETSAQRDFLRANNAGIYQGYLFSQPVCASEAMRFLKREVDNE